MPILDPVKRAKIQALGFDPDKLEDTAPTIQTEEQPKTNPTSSIIGSFTRGAASGALPNAVGIGTGLALSELTPLVSIPAGIGASMVAEGIQNRILPTATKEQLETDALQHPWASSLGRLVSSGTLLKPNVNSIKNLGSLLSKEAAPEAVSAAKETLKNMALNAGVQGGVGATIKGIQQGTITPELDSSDVINALGGALFNKPTQLANRIPKVGINKLVINPQEPEPVINSALVNDELLNMPRLQEPINYNSVEPSYAGPTELALSAGAMKEGKSLKSLIPSPDAEITALQKIDAEEKAKQEDLDRIKQFKKIEEQKRAEAIALAQELKNQKTPELAPIEEPIKMGEQLPKDEFDLALKKRNYLQVAFEKAKQEMELHDLEEKMKSNQIPEATGISEERNPIQTTELGKEILPDYTGNMEHDNLQNAQDSGLIDQLHNKLEGLKIKNAGQLYGGIQGLSVSAWNGSLNAVQMALKGGLKLSEAIKAGIDWIKKNHPDSQFDENEYHTGVTNHLLSNAKLAAPIQGAAAAAAATIQQKLEQAKSVGINTTNPQQIVAIHQSPVQPNTIPSSWNKLKVMIPEIDKIRNLGPTGKKVGDAFANYYDKLTSYRGQLVNSFTRNIRQLADMGGVINTITKPGEYLSQNTPELEHVRDWFWAKHDGTTVPNLTSNEEKIRDEIIRINGAVRAKQIQLGIGNKTVINPDYLAQTIDSKVLETLLQHPESAKAQQLKQDYLTYTENELLKKGTDPAKAKQQALESLQEIVAPSSRLKSNTTGFFGPIDKAEGLGIPISWREKNLMLNQTRYLDRVARRFAYEEKIKPVENDINTIGSNVSLDAVHKDIIGDHFYDDPLINNLSGITRSAMMGTLTGLKDFASNITLGVQHHENIIQSTANMLKAWGSMKQNIADGYASGRIRQHMNSLELSNGFDDVIGALKRSRDVLSDISGRNTFDQLARASAIGQARFTTLDFLEQLNKGKLSKMGEKWFKDFGEDTNWKSGKLTPQEMLDITGRYVDSTQGTYDYRGLPRQALEGQLSPILQLARWNIEKSNNFIKYTVKPLMQGNITPALNTTLGIILGGEVVQAIVQAVTGRKDKTPTLKEIAATDQDKLMPLFYKLAGLNSVAGHTGMLGDLTKGILDKTYGKNRPQVYNNVMLEAVDNTGTLLAGLVNSIAKDGLSSDVALGFINQLLESNVQNYRLMLGYLSANTQADIDKANKLRDLKVYNTLEGNKIVDSSSPFRVMLTDVKAKTFKNETDPNKIIDEANELKQRAINRSGGDRKKLEDELRSLKGNSYQTMPNPNTDLAEFGKYFQFIKKTQGEDAAKSLVEDYKNQNRLNQAKAALIP